jgi:RNA polymerase sigma factor (sigma-70 family)
MNISPAEIRALVRIETQRTGLPLHDEDLAQDAAVKAIEAFQRQFEVRYPRALLRKIVGDTVRDHWRRRRPPENLDDVQESLCAPLPSFEEELDQQRRVDLLRRGLAELDDAKRRTLGMFYEEDCRVAEIARRQEKSVSAVKMELLRTRRELRRILQRLERERSSR